MKKTPIQKQLLEQKRYFKKRAGELHDAFRRYYRDVVNRRLISIGYYWPGAKDGASFNAKSVYERVKAGEILGYETIISTDGDDIVFHFRKNLPSRPVYV